MVDRLERLTDLVLVLLRDQRPKSLREIASEVPGYPAQEGEARRQAFERDKRTLRDGGIEVTTMPIDGPEQMGYVILPEDYYLPDLDLAPDEQAALNLAVAGVHLGDPSGRDALWRLGLPASAGARTVAELPALPALPALHAALRARATVTFDYRGDRRRVDPALLRFHGGWWYLVGHDLDRAAPRTFRVDRMDGAVSAGEPGSAVLPDGFDPDAALPDVPWRIGEGALVSVELRVDSSLAGLVLDEVGEGALVGRADDGSAVVRLDVTNIGALRSWLFELGDHAEVVGPEEVRADIVAWLEALSA
jgi:proteasome accessory factor B